VNTAGAYSAVVLGASAGGLTALSAIFSALPAAFPLPLIAVQHRAKDHKDLLEDVLRQKTRLVVKQASEKEQIQAGHAYIAPPDYHLLIEDDMTFSLASFELVLYSRPSIDVLFESAAAALGKRTIGILLTGASADGSKGIEAIHTRGGVTIAQDPEEAQYPAMPRAAIKTGKVGHVWRLAEIISYLEGIGA
jgi:two-component system chemotaxis response regulator CheB